MHNNRTCQVNISIGIKMQTHWQVEKYNIHWRRLTRCYPTLEQAQRQHPSQPGTRYIQIVCHDEDTDKTEYRPRIVQDRPKRKKVKTLREIRESDL